MQVKVCGITQIDQLQALDVLAVDYAGLIFYPPSPRFVLKAGLQGSDVKEAKFSLRKVGVFVNAPYEEVMRRIDEYGLDMVQLHGRETPSECQKIAANIEVIKAFRITGNDPVESITNDFQAGPGYFLFDTGAIQQKADGRETTVYGGTGHKFDWNSLHGLTINKPYFLSGGIEPTDAETIKAFMAKDEARDMIAVDINSRFEIEPGVKNMEHVAVFVSALKNGHGKG